MKYLVLTFAVMIMFAQALHAQSLGDRVLNKAKQRANRKIDRTIDKGFDEVEKGIDEGVSGDKNDNKNDSKTDKSSSKGGSDNKDTSESNSSSAGQAGEPAKAGFAAYTKYDFVAGDVPLFVDDFSSDNIGDFPAKWNTNGSGEVVSTDNSGKWFELKLSSVYVPTLPRKLPENYTIEFDLKTDGITEKTSSTARLELRLDDNTKFNAGKNWVWLRMYLTQYVNVGVRVKNAVNGESIIDNQIKEDFRSKMKSGAHIAIAVTKKRLRLWIDENKVIDIPTVVPPTGIQTIKFGLEGFTNDFANARIFISNVKVAEGGVDLRSKLITEGKLSTTAITFNVNSDRIKPESMGTIKEIADVLTANPGVNIKIIGHTDSDGDESSNLELSKKRAAAVKNAMVEHYGIKADRIQTDGKGESQPAAGNDSPEGKAANRRVEFIKL